MTAGLPHLRQEPHAPDDLVFCAKVLEVGGHTCNVSPARVNVSVESKFSPNWREGSGFFFF